MRKIIYFKIKPYFISSAAVGGYEERRGPLGKAFDFCDDSDRFGKKTWEAAEGEMGRICLSFAMKKAGLQSHSIDALLAGDLENQCVASSGGLYSFGIPYMGLYGACSTCAESLLILSTLISNASISVGATVTTSHNSAAERQFRTPIEYGAQRTPSSQWTATAAGAFILSSEKKTKAYINNAMIGKIVDGLTTDGSNMGAAMSRAAYDSVYTYLTLTNTRPEDYDAIYTGDLGKEGAEIFCNLLKNDFPLIDKKHKDCGMLLYDFKKSNVNSGASGCGCSASVLSSHILPKFSSGEYKNILFLSTGALMNPSSILQGENILGVAPLINIKGEN
ncbi:MAG: stage V sporulation protein AD [Clostridia bacterium]|nr:stage V sporulation protein AD [Clostridia bacterium]